MNNTNSDSVNVHAIVLVKNVLVTSVGVYVYHQSTM
jgi:hypothetical protein